MYAEKRDLSLRQVNRKMIGVFRHFIERKLTNDICSSTIAHDSVGLQFHRSIIEEFGGARQYLSDESDAVVGFHGLDLYINIDVTGTEQKLAWGSSDAADTGQHRLIERIENQ